ncbi:MAG: hypothetical protein RLZ44_594, partial [Pseudomonadota bacterium]
DKYLRPSGPPPEPAHGIRWLAPAIAVTFNVVLLGACVIAGRWFLYPMLWLYPLLAVAIAVNIIRTIAEHQPEEYPNYEGERETAMRPLIRTTVPSWFEKWLMYQANFNFHVEHHVFPVVPQCHLKTLHEHLETCGFYALYPSARQSSGMRRFLGQVGFGAPGSPKQASNAADA